MTDTEAPWFLLSVRFLIAFVAFLGYAVQYIQRIDMSVAIVCMVNNTAVKQAFISQVGLANVSSAISTDDEKCYFKQYTEGGASFDGPFFWDKKVQGLVLASYFYGYLTTQILGGVFSIKFGAKIVLALAILIGSLLTLLIPIAANISYYGLVVCRFFTGVAHGAFWPAMSTLWAYWAPPNERSRLAGIANAGAQIGNVIALPVGGFLCVYGPFGGWPSIFYFFGAIGVVWFVLWMVVSARSPSEHRFISEKEREYVVDQTRETVANTGKIPVKVVKKMFQTKAFYAVVFAHTASNFGTYLFLTQLPTYMKEVLKFDIKSNGGLSALPYIAFWLLTIVSSIIGDHLIKSQVLSKTGVRKLFNSIGLLVPMSAVLALAFVTCKTPYLGVAFVILGLAFTGPAYGAGFMVNYNDISGSFAGLSLGLSNTFGTMPGFIAPSLVGFITTHQKQEEWMIVFFITAAVYLVGAVGFLLMANGELQDYAKKPTTAAKDQEESVPLREQKS